MKTSDKILSGILALNLTYLASGYMPVTLLMTSTVYSIVESTVTLHVKGFKIRGCEYVEGSETGWYMIGGEPIETPFEYYKDESPGNSRVASWLSTRDFGLFRWFNVPDTADAVRLTAQHNCNGDIKTREIGIWKFK